MLQRYINEINKDLERTKKAIIALGCSFVQGQGALGDQFYQTYNWHANPDSPFSDVSWNFSEADLKRLQIEHPEIDTTMPAPIPLTELEYTNTFVKTLAEKYFEGEYTPINFGIAGKGNRATIKELHYYPSINWSKIEEYIVVYCPSGAERFDFIDDQHHQPNNHYRWISMWPNKLPEDSGKAKLWEGYKESLHSAKFEVLEQITHMQELKLWCAHHKAKLLVVPAFQRLYTKQYFSDILQTVIGRDSVTGKLQNEGTGPFNRNTRAALEMWPWENMFQPDGCETFADLVMKQEFPEKYTSLWFYNYLKTGTPNMWITPCAHPNAKGHELFAKFLHKEITENLNKYSVTYR